MKRVFLIFNFLLLFSLNLFAQNNSIKVISPIPGNWSNRQMLLIDKSEDIGNTEYYYSLNGSNPEVSGFAYDGPVLLDISGEVNLRVAKVSPNKETVEVAVNYTVVPDAGYAHSYGEFISSFFETGVYNYTCGVALNIPEELQFNFDDERESYVKGQPLVISSTNVVSRQIPCTVYDVLKNKKWRFIINTFPENAGAFTKRNVPFEISEWKNITFKNPSYIYRIDNQYWQSFDKPVVIDRKKEHKIYWQSVNYAVGNPIECFILPAAPRINEKTDENGGVVYSLVGDDSYMLGIHSDGERVLLYDKVGVDTFYGHNVSGEIEMAIYCNSVYQGKIKRSYNIKKRIPGQPQYSTEAPFYSRKDISVVVSSETDSELYYQISKPYLLTETYDSYKPEVFAPYEVQFNEYKKAANGNAKIVLKAQDDGAVYYRIRAYSKNGKHRSIVSEFSAVIDQFNYFVDERANSVFADGSFEYPFTDLNQCLSLINKGNYSRIKILGPVHLDGQYQLESNCEIINEDEGELIFTPNSTLTVKNSSLMMKDCNILMENDNPNSQNQIVPLLKLENSVLEMNNCQIIANFGKNGTVIESYQSSIILNDTISSVNGGVYCSFISAIRSRINCLKSYLNVSSQTAVVLTVNDSNVDIKECSFKVTGGMGRIAEFFGCKGAVVKNIFNAELSEAGKSTAIYKDSKSSITEQGNENYGF